MPQASHPTTTIDVRSARRLALARAGLLPTRWSGLPTTARGAGPTAREAATRVIERFGYLQLDTISVTGARSHALVLLSRLRGMDAALGERLLVPGARLFEYWGHEASWLPLDLYPLMEFRRTWFREHPRWGPLVAGAREEADALLRRARDGGPFRSSDLEGGGTGAWWGGKRSKRIAEALWRSGELAIRERTRFQRVYDLTERVIPSDVLARRVPLVEATRQLILHALDGHGWAEERTIAATWRLRQRSPHFVAALQSLADDGEILPCTVRDGGELVPGWIRPAHLDLAARLRRIRPRKDDGVLLTPFDPILWDRVRARRLFGFDVVLEIYVPAEKRRFGYYCMPVLAGERLIGRIDVKADRKAGVVRAVSTHYECGNQPPAEDVEAMRTALARHARAVGLDVER